MDYTQYIPSAQEAHAIAAHLPVALSVLGVLGVLAAIVVRTQRDSLRWAVVGMYLLLAASAVVAKKTGGQARIQVSGSLSPDIWDLLSRHNHFADRVWMFGVGTAVVVAVSIAARGMLRTSMSVVAVLASLCTVGWVGVTGHLGGELVYQHGIGIPPDKVVEWRINPPKEKLTEGAPVPAAAMPRKLIPIDEIDMGAAQKVSYTHDVLPVLQEACYECHSPKKKIEAKFDMTTVAGLIKGGEKYGASLVPGKPDESTLVKYSRGELLPQMPKDELPLGKAEIHLLREWIAAGARDDTAERTALEPLKP